MSSKVETSRSWRGKDKKLVAVALVFISSNRAGRLGLRRGLIFPAAAAAFLKMVDRNDVVRAPTGRLVGL